MAATVQGSPLHAKYAEAIDRESAHEKLAAKVESEIAGGATTTSAYLAAGHIDELRVHIAPFVSGLAGAAGGSRLFDGVPNLGLVPVATREPAAPEQIVAAMEGMRTISLWLRPRPVAPKGPGPQVAVPFRQAADQAI